MRNYRRLIFVCAFLVVVITRSAFCLASGNAVVGINFMGAGKMTVAQQNDVLGKMKNAGVHTIRTGITPDDLHGIDFAHRAQEQGISIVWIVSFQYRPDAPNVPWPNPYNSWGGHPLSSADPDQFRAYFEPMLAKLEASGVILAGLELGNEINGGAFNADFVLPPETGQPRLFGAGDLESNPHAQQIATGFLQYLKVLAVLKDVRDHSKLNRSTPIISAGLVGTEYPEGPRTGVKLDGVSTAGTIEFMRAHGLDQLVDAYGIHVYPSTDNPGKPEALQRRKSLLAQYDLSECQPGGRLNGKPCWITEWGFTNHDSSCPVHEANQVALVQEMRADFQPYVARGSVVGLLYYAWPDSNDNYTVYRCDSLTNTGKLALSPM